MAIGMSLYALVYEKAYHLPLELEYKAQWALKKLKLNLTRVGDAKKLQLNELIEWRLTHMKIASCKLKSRWFGPFIIRKVFPHEAVELMNEDDDNMFKVNGQCLKLYHGGSIDRIKETIGLDGQA
ncbi:uncharacterized protein LOC120090901 [Benincasa hispida]|uniref:uncharacterized protein LOC120090901 n=1 Tax=Benincasa hispida TaxID=102211 RepID=UPI0019001AA1|nr:uncharacterized protein LOC120090901 [Benincasa hispida]